MDFVCDVAGSPNPIIKKFQVGESMATAAVPVLIGGSNNEGLALATTTAAADMVGVTIDTATLVAAQQSDNSDPAAYVSVIINPNAVYKAKLSGGATSGTALTLYDVTTASTDGLDITTGDTWTGTEFDEGVVWGYDGANAGVARKITSTSATAATVIVAFPNDTVVGDNFLRAPFVASPVGMENQFVQLTSDLTQINASVAVDTGNNNFRPYELWLRDISDNGRTNSWLLMVPFDHIFAGGGSI